MGRAAPLTWFAGAVVLLWYARHGREHRPAWRKRPWYPKRVMTFADMLGCRRLVLWEHWWSARGDRRPARQAAEAWLLDYLATAACKTPAGRRRTTDSRVLILSPGRKSSPGDEQIARESAKD